MNDAPTVLVTGSSDGIGLATARELHRRGWHVLVHGRSEAKARATALRIESKQRSATAVWGDFSNMDSVVDVARQVRGHTATLDALVNNAGVYAKKREITADGFELTMAVNHFAPFLLTHHLLPQLIDAAAARVVTVSSMTHSGASVDLSDLDFEHAWDAYAAYAASKLANILFTRQLARRLAGTKVSANALHPGVIGTKLLRAGFSMGGGSVEDGARTSIYLVDSVEPRGVSGKYFVDCHEAPVSRAASDPRLAAGLWDASTERLSAYL